MKPALTPLAQRRKKFWSPWRRWRGGIFSWGLVLGGLLFSGCTETEKLPPQQIVVDGDNTVAVALASPFEIHIRTLAAPTRTLLGAQLSQPAVGVKAQLTVTAAPPDAPDLPPWQTHTGNDGRAKFSLAGLAAAGIYSLTITLPDYPEITARQVFVYGGLTLTGGDQDGWTNSLLEAPIIITCQQSGQRPAPGVNLFLDLHPLTEGAKLLQDTPNLTTGDNGTAQFAVRLGAGQGRGEIGVRVLSAPWRSEENVPDLRIKFFVIDAWRIIFAVAGGLAIFVFGMGMMSDGLTLIAGDRLRRLLQSLARNRIAATGMGVVITGFIQSSSATSVMVIGFVNAGLMALEQAIGVIIGANIGTTVTAQMISFKLEVLAYPAIVCGVIYSLAAQKSYAKYLAQILIGFGLLFLGMTLMGEPLGELRYSRFIHDIFSHLDCQPVNGLIPLGGMIKAMLAGMIMTAIMQSSSAFIGVLLSISGAGMIDVCTAFVVLLGSNIGTTVTAVLATIGTGPTARRVACSHVIFNFVGAILVAATLYIPWHGHPAFLVLINQITPGDAFGGENLTRFLANAHTVFNVVAAAIFLLFLRLLTKTVYWLLPDNSTPQPTASLLEPHLLRMPALAMALVWREIGVMLHKGRDAFFQSLREVFKEDREYDTVKGNVEHLEQSVNELQSAVASYVSNLTAQQPLSERQRLTVPAALHAVNDAERISDHAVSLLRLSARVHKHQLKISPEANAELQAIAEALGDLFDKGILAVEEKLSAAEMAHLGQKELQRLHKMISDAGKAYIARQESGLCDVRSGAIYQEVLYVLHRVCSHLTNIIKRAGE